ncbi:MAG TPA: DUF1801 domain-containing protein [Chitinophagaceae bacterium]|nr:DUF1801 domain-containing protein [Chitinophagaceae bacterium]
MAKISSPKPTETEQVKEWMNKLNPGFTKAINTVRKIIKMAGPKLHERIKWNAPSYYYKPSRPDESIQAAGEDIVTFGPTKAKDKIMLVFHHPNIVKIESRLLQGNFKDRRLVYLNSMKEIKEAQAELEKIIKKSVQLMQKG